MFVEQKGDAEMAELFAMGLLKEKDAFNEKRLVLVPCKHPKLCKTHGTTRIRLRMLKKKIQRKIKAGNKSRTKTVLFIERKIND